MPKIETRNMQQLTLENNNFDYNSHEILANKGYISTNLNFESENYINYDKINLKSIMNHSNDLFNDNEQKSENNLINIQNEIKGDASLLENQDIFNTPKKEFLDPNNKRISMFQKDSEDLKFVIDKEILGKGHNSYLRLKSESYLKSISRKKSPNFLLHESINESEKDENNNNSQYDRFCKTKQKLETPNENNEEEYKKIENEEKEVKIEDGFFELGLKKPKRKIQINIFTQKNKDNEELKELEQFMRKLENNEENELFKKTMNDTKEFKGKIDNKRDNLKTSPLKHPLVFPEFNKYGLYSGYKKQELKMKYGYTVLKMNQFNKKNLFESNDNLIESKDISITNNNCFNNKLSQDDVTFKKKSPSPMQKDQNDKKPKKQRLPKIKEKLQKIYKENPEILKTIKNLKNETNLSLEEYQLKLMDVARKFLDDENLKNLANRFKEITEISDLKEKVKFHRSINRWEIMVNSISKYIPEYLVEKLKSQK